MIDLVPRKSPHGKVKEHNRYEGISLENVNVRTKSHHKYDNTIKFKLRKWLSRIAFAHDFKQVDVFLILKCKGAFVRYKFIGYEGSNSNRSRVKNSVLEHLRDKLHEGIEPDGKWKHEKALKFKASFYETKSSR